MTLKQIGKIFLVVIWAIAGCYLLNTSLEWMSMADSMINTIGVLLMTCTIIVSIIIINFFNTPSAKAQGPNPKTQKQDEKSN